MLPESRVQQSLLKPICHKLLSYTKDNLRNSDDFRVTVHRQKEYLPQTGQ